MTYARYSENVETVESDEDETATKIIEAMRKGAQATRERYGRSVRASHAKAHGILSGKLVVMPNLPPELAQGLFARPAAFDVVVRLAHVPGELLDDRRVSTPRGMAIKVLGVEGAKLAGHTGSTQDFVLDTGKVFNTPGAKSFLAAISATEAATAMPEGVKAAVSAVSRATNSALNAVGLNSANLDFYGHPFNHPLSESYYSQAPLRYGEYVAKLGVVPTTATLLDLSKREFEPQDENGLRTAVVQYFRDNPAEFDVCIQLCTDLDAMPVENANAEWSEQDSPYRRVARLTFAAQDAYSERGQTLDEDLSFCISHSLAAHRPLGSLNRARLKVYQLMADARRRANGRTTAEPTNAIAAANHDRTGQDAPMSATSR